MTAETIRVWGEGRRALWTPEGEVDVPDAFVEVKTGDALLTRRIKAHADVVYVRMKRKRRFSSAVAVLAPKDAVERARVDVKETAKARAEAAKKREIAEGKRIAAFVERARALYPSMPVDEATRCIEYAFEVGSGRVGRANKRGEDLRIHLAVRAHIRHRHTDYEKVIKKLGRRRARNAVQKQLDALVAEWQRP